MKKSHIFMNKFFCGREWLTMYIPHGTTWSSWTGKIEARTKMRGEFAQQFLIRIEQKVFYTQYIRYMKENFPSSKPRNIDTFMKEVGELGVLVHAKRKPVNKRNYHVVDVFYSRVSGWWSKLYPDIEFNAWDSEDHRKAFVDELTKFQCKPRAN